MPRTEDGLLDTAKGPPHLKASAASKVTIDPWSKVAFVVSDSVAALP